MAKHKLSDILKQIASGSDTTELSLQHAKELCLDVVNHFLLKTDRSFFRFFSDHQTNTIIDSTLNIVFDRKIVFYKKKGSESFDIKAATSWPELLSKLTLRIYPQILNISGAEVDVFRSQYIIHFDIYGEIINLIVKQDNRKAVYELKREDFIPSQDICLIIADQMGKADGSGIHFLTNKLQLVPWFDGGDLFDYLEKGLPPDEGLSSKQGKILILIIALRINKIHKLGYVHNDIKSENILFNKELFMQGKFWEAIRIIDLRHLTKNNELLFKRFGTIGYIPKEAIAPYNATFFDDIFASAIVFMLILIPTMGPYYFPAVLKLIENYPIWGNKEVKAQYIDSVRECNFELLNAYISTMPLARVLQACFVDNSDYKASSFTMEHFIFEMITSDIEMMEVAAELCTNANESTQLFDYIRSLFSPSKEAVTSEVQRKELASRILQGLTSQEKKLDIKEIEKLVNANLAAGALLSDTVCSSANVPWLSSPIQAEKKDDMIVSLTATPLSVASTLNQMK